MFNLYSKFDYPTVLRRWFALVLICCAATSINAQETTENKSDGDNMFAGTQQAASVTPAIRPVRTDSPRETLTSFLRLRDELEETLQTYRANKSRKLFKKMQVIRIPSSMRCSTCPLFRYRLTVRSESTQLHICSTSLGVSNCLTLQSVPDEAAFDRCCVTRKMAHPRHPDLDRPGQIRESVRGSFYLARTRLWRQPRFYQAVNDLPLQTSLPITSWHRAIPQITGPMIPAAVLRIIPLSLHEFWLETPRWKVITVVLISTLAALLLFVFHRATNRREIENRVGFLLRRALTPIADPRGRLEPKGFH